MSERKPPGMRWESWIDRQIREAEERGEFENLPGKGKPLPDLGKPRDELWWVKQLLRRENLKVTPETLALRKELENVEQRVADAGSEPEVRRIVTTINDRIRAVNARPATGPPSNLVPLDVEHVVRSWRDRPS